MNTSDQLPLHGIKEDMQQHRDSIPPEDRCVTCDGNGMISKNGGRFYTSCPKCEATGKKPTLGSSK
jgi:DnaJ-class molecular chaperone